MSIAVRNLVKKFGTFTALHNVSITFPAGQLTALLGPSGCGKTSLLRIIAGLEEAEEGSVLFDGEDASSRAARDRRVGFVFQHYALFRHMTVFENVAFGLKVKPRRQRPSPADIAAKVHALLELVQMDWLANRYPAQLSGGQRQRVALARALAVEPKVLLLDEPFGALDAKVRKELRRWLRRLHDTLHVTSVFVTHDVEEAMEVADLIVVMHQGVVEQIGPPAEVYDRPATPFVCDFLGHVNRLEACWREGRAEVAPPTLETDATLIGYVRPHDLEVARERRRPTDIEAEVVHLAQAGSIVRLELRRIRDSLPMDVELSRERFLALNLSEAERVFVHPHQIRVFPDSPRSPT